MPGRVLKRRQFIEPFQHLMGSRRDIIGARLPNLADQELFNGFG